MERKLWRTDAFISLENLFVGWVAFFLDGQAYYIPKLKVRMHVQLWSVKMWSDHNLTACYCHEKYKITNVKIWYPKVYSYLLSGVYVGHLTTTQQWLSFGLFYCVRSWLANQCTSDRTRSALVNEWNKYLFDAKVLFSYIHTPQSPAYRKSVWTHFADTCCGRLRRFAEQRRVTR